jgi:hypothetical protein
VTRTTKTLIIVATFCLVTGRSVTFAQFKFSKGGGSRNSSSRNSSSKSSRFSSNQSKGGNSFRKKPSSTNSGQSRNNFNSSKLGRFTAPRTTPSYGNSNGLSSRFGNTRGKSTFTNSLSKQLSNNTRFGKTDRQSKTTLDIRRKLDLKSSRTQKKTLPFIDNLKKNGIANAIGNNGNGNGNGKRNNSGNSAWQNVVKHMVNHKFQKNHWCNTRPASCHWWVNYCKPIAHCHHHEVVVCDWNRVRCNTVVYAGHAPQEIQWYLGLKGILLPGKGLGVEAVEAGSPAELVGLRPGMVMTVCNGIQLVDETSMQEAIRISGGVLQMTLLSADGGQVLEGTVQMTRIAAVSF